jgi:NAD+ diphosphatase
LNASPTVALVLFDYKKRVLLAIRDMDPHRGKFDLAGGFVDLGETLEQAMHREAHEELGLLESDYSKPIFIESVALEYEFSREVKPVVSVTFAAHLLHKKQIHPRQDVLQIVYVTMEELQNIDPHDFAWLTWRSHILKAYALLFRD